MVRFGRPVGRACLTFGFALFFPALTLAQVVVTGVTQSGNQLVVAGSGFGTHGDYGGSQSFLNAAWNDFSTAINGGNLALDGTNNSVWSYQTTGGRTSTGRWARKDYNASLPDSIRRLGSLSLQMSGTTGTYYSSFWLRCGTGINSAAKFWRIYGANVQNVFMSIDQDRNLMSYSNVNGNPPPTTVWSVVTDPMRCSTTWQHFEVYIRDTPGNDLIEVQIDGVQAFRRGSNLPSLHRDIEGSMSNEREQWIASPWGGDGHTMDFGHMADGNFWGFSDIYVDFTRARVEVSDSPTWALARHKEIQIPTQWSNGQITVRSNRGSFSAGQQLYLYVVDSNGNANAAGYPVNIAGGGITAPAAPTSLRIIGG